MKLIGGIMIALVGVIMALSHRKFEWRKLETLDGFISLIMYIKGQIDCYSRPRKDILATLPAEVFCACNCPMGAESLEEMVEASRIYLDEEPQRLLSAFVAEFGSTFRDEQLRRCDYYVSALGEQRRIVANEVQVRSRTGGTLWICACIAVLILMW